jgi:hypothetical protein
MIIRQHLFIIFDNLAKSFFELSKGRSRLGRDPLPAPPMAGPMAGLFDGFFESIKF